MPGARGDLGGAAGVRRADRGRAARRAAGPADRVRGPHPRRRPREHARDRLPDGDSAETGTAEDGTSDAGTAGDGTSGDGTAGDGGTTDGDPATSTGSPGSAGDGTSASTGPAEPTDGGADASEPSSEPTSDPAAGSTAEAGTTAPASPRAERAGRTTKDRGSGRTDCARGSCRGRRCPASAVRGRSSRPPTSRSSGTCSGAPTRRPPTTSSVTSCWCCGGGSTTCRPTPPSPWAYGVARGCLANNRRSAVRQERVVLRLARGNAVPGTPEPDERARRGAARPPGGRPRAAAALGLGAAAHRARSP